MIADQHIKVSKEAKSLMKKSLVGRETYSDLIVRVLIERKEYGFK